MRPRVGKAPVRRKLRSTEVAGANEARSRAGRLISANQELFRRLAHPPTISRAKKRR